MSVPTRHTVHLARTEHRLTLPAPLTSVHDLLALARDELRGLGRQLDEAEARVVQAALVISWDTPRATVRATEASR